MKVLFFRFIILFVLNLFFPVCTVADTLQLRTTDGINGFDNVVFQGLKHQGGKTIFFIQIPPDAEAHEVEAERIVELTFTDGQTPGRYFDITFAGLPGNQVFFPSSKVFSFSNMTLYAVAPGKQEPEAVNIKMISTLVAGVTPIPTPVPMARPVEDEEEWYDEIDFDSEPLSLPSQAPTSLTGGSTIEDAIAQHSAPLVEQGVGGYEVNTDQGIAPINNELSDEEMGMLAGLGILFIFVLIFAIIVMLMNLTVVLWMFVHAIQSGEWGYVVAMVFFCGGLPSVIYLYSKYDGPAARFLKIFYAVTYLPLVIMYAIAVAFGN